MEADVERSPYDRDWEDFPEGRKIESRGLTVTEAHVVNWSMITGDWLPIHLDAEFCKSTHFGERVVHGPLTLSMAIGLVVQTGWFGDAIIAWLGLDEVRVPKPVRTGDTIRVRVAVVEAAPTSKAQRGRVKCEYTVANQNGDVVMTFFSSFLMRRRAA